MPASYDNHRRQLELVLRAWGMKPINAAITADIMAWADLHGIDSHGISMLPTYDERRNAARRQQEGIPVGPNLLAKVKNIARAAQVEWLLD